LIDTIKNITDFIALNFLVVFGMYSIIYFLIRLIVKDKTFIERFDKSAINLMIWVGAFWALLKLIGVLIFIYQMKEYETFRQHLTWFLDKSWFQLLFWMLLSQLLRINLVRKFLLIRIVISLLFVLPFDLIGTMLNYINTDYWPTILRDLVPFDFSLNTMEISIKIFTKISIFFIIVSIYHFGKLRIISTQQRA